MRRSTLLPTVLALCHVALVGQSEGNVSVAQNPLVRYFARGSSWAFVA